MCICLCGSLLHFENSFSPKTFILRSIGISKPSSCEYEIELFVFVCVFIKCSPFALRPPECVKQGCWCQRAHPVLGARLPLSIPLEAMDQGLLGELSIQPVILLSPCVRQYPNLATQLTRIRISFAGFLTNPCVIFVDSRPMLSWIRDQLASSGCGFQCALGQFCCQVWKQLTWGTNTLESEAVVIPLGWEWFTANSGVEAFDGLIMISKSKLTRRVFRQLMGKDILSITLSQCHKNNNAVCKTWKKRRFQAQR